MSTKRRIHDPDCPGCDQRLDFLPCAQLGGYRAVQGPCEARHCPMHLGLGRLGLPYLEPRDVCALWAARCMGDDPSQADVARAIGVSEETIRRDELAAAEKVRAAVGPRHG